MPFAWMAAVNMEGKPWESNFERTRVWARRALHVLGYRLEVKNEAHLEQDRGYFFICNHQGTLDPALLAASCPKQIHFVSKKKNERLPVLGRFARAAGVIHFDRDTKEGNIFMLRQTMKYLKKKQSILLFPEGTRSRSQKMNPFMENSMAVAKFNKADIVPVTINYAFDLDGADKPHKTMHVFYGQVLPYETYKNWTEEQRRRHAQDLVSQNLMED